MALANEILEGRLQQLLARRLGMQSGAPAPTLAPEVLPTIGLELDRPEWGFLKGENPYGVGINISADAANNSAVRLRLAAAANAIVPVIVQVSVGTTGQVRAFLTAETADLSTAIAAVPRDGRLTLGQGSAVKCSGQNNSDVSGLVSNFWRMPVLVNELVQLPIVILTPGRALQLQTANTNTTLVVSAWWTERAAVQGELLG